MMNSKNVVINLLIQVLSIVCMVHFYLQGKNVFFIFYMLNLGIYVVCFSCLAYVFMLKRSIVGKCDFVKKSTFEKIYLQHILLYSPVIIFITVVSCYFKCYFIIISFIVYQLVNLFLIKKNVKQDIYFICFFIMMIAITIICCNYGNIFFS